MGIKSFIKNKSYKFTDKKRSVRGIISVIYLVSALVLISYAVYISYRQKGHGGREIGALGAMALMLSAAGVGMGIYGFKEEEVFLKLPWIGTVGNTIIFLFLLGTVLVGI